MSEKETPTMPPPKEKKGFKDISGALDKMDSSKAQVYAPGELNSPDAKALADTRKTLSGAPEVSFQAGEYDRSDIEQAGKQMKKTTVNKGVIAKFLSWLGQSR